METADILVYGGAVVTADASDTQLADGAVAIRGDRIAAVGSTRDFRDWQVARRIDAKGGVIMPGLINVHTHAAMTCFRGLADDLPLMTWLNEHIFPAEAKMDAAKVYCGALLACAEMILSGTTCFCDMYLFEDAVARAARHAGIRAVVGEVLYDFPSPNYGPIEQGFAYTRDLIARWQQDPLISIAVEPHSPYLCAPKVLQQAFALAQSNGVPMVIHLAETRNEVDTIRKKFQRSPVEHLANLGVLGPNLVACHCVVLTEDDIELLRRHNVKVAHNPESNMKLASGIAPIPQLLKAGICVGLGTDGCASNNNLDLFLEMDTMAKIHKVRTLDPTALDARTAVRIATIDGARALGLGDVTGSLETGKKADLIVIDVNKPHLTPMYHPVSHLVYAVRGSDVSTSIINGSIVMEDRRLLTLDVQKAMEDVRRIALELTTED